LSDLTRSYTQISSLVDRNFLDSTATIADHFDRLSNNPAFANVVAELQRIRPALERYEYEVRDAPDRDSATLSLREGLKAVAEGLTGANLRVRSGADRLKLYVVLLGLALSLLQNYSQSQDERAQSTDISELRAVQQSQAETIRLLGETIRDIQKTTLGSGTFPIVTFSKRSVLRSLPTSQSHRVVEVEAGEDGRVVLINGRWMLIELVSQGNTFGWVYRRNIRFHSEDDKSQRRLSTTLLEKRSEP
jgi:hypothetical protein